MFKALRFLLLAHVVMLAGCSVYPSTEDVTGFDPFEIERHIRCEMKATLQDKFIDLAKQAPQTAALSDELERDRSKFKTLLQQRFPPEIARYIREYYFAAVAYDFTFDITEENNNDNSINFLAGLTGGTFKLGVKSANNLSRQGIAKFQATDQFGSLIANDLVCDPRMSGSRLEYPITGQIGLYKPLRQFIDLNEFGNLSGEKDKVPTYTATFNFQTVISASVSPSITVSPVSHGVNDAAFNSASKRTDIHKLIVAFSLDPKAKRPLPIDILGLTSVSPGSAKTPSEQQALRAVDAARLSTFFDRLNQFPLVIGE